VKEIKIKKGQVLVEKQKINDLIVQRKAYINENGALVEEWDIPGQLKVPFETIIKKFRRVGKV